MRQIYYSDRLELLQDRIRVASSGLIYHPPPFYSTCSYNLLFGTPKGHHRGRMGKRFAPSCSLKPEWWRK